MKRILIFVFCISISAPIFSIPGIANNGRRVELNDDYTWAYSEPEAKPKNQNVLEEPKLFSLAIREDKAILFDQYLEYYDSLNMNNTISIIYFYANSLNNYGLPFIAQDQDYIELLQKGILYTERYAKIFQIINPVSKYSRISNLWFFWEYANILEYTKKYTEALEMYSKLEKYYMETNQQFSYDIIDEGLETIQGKIYLLNLLCGSV